MHIINWENSYKTKLEIIDNQHFDFITQLNELFTHDSIKNKFIYKKKIDLIITRLLEHFATEEKLMKEHNYSGYYTHKLEHDRFINKFSKQANELIDTNFLFVDNFLLSIEKWFVNHLKINDKKLANFIIDLQNTK